MEKLCGLPEVSSRNEVHLRTLLTLAEQVLAGEYVPRKDVEELVEALDYAQLSLEKLGHKNIVVDAALAKFKEGE